MLTVFNRAYPRAQLDWKRWKITNLSFYIKSFRSQNWHTITLCHSNLYFNIPPYQWIFVFFGPLVESSSLNHYDHFMCFENNFCFKIRFKLCFDLWVGLLLLLGTEGQKLSQFWVNRAPCLALLFATVISRIPWMTAVLYTKKWLICWLFLHYFFKHGLKCPNIAFSRFWFICC